MDAASPHGLFVVFDGNDGSGKATQTKLLTEKLAQNEVVVETIDFPQYSNNVFGKLLSECLSGSHGDFVNLDPKIASSLYALDRYESSPVIRTWIAEGKVVVADRFASSNQIHQGGKVQDPDERAAFMKWLDVLEHEVLETPRPDAIIYLRVPLEISVGLLQNKRAAKNQALQEGEQDVVEKDRTYLLRSISSAEDLAATSPNWHVIDCMKSGALRTPESIHEEVYAIISQLLPVVSR